MEDELFGERHEQEEHGLFGKQHEKELLNLFSVSQRSELVCDKPSPVRCAKWQRFENGCLDCNMIREQTCG